ncbi:MAG: gamma-glutamyltransferase [Rickettsiales bacterium]|nr:gamma-glutamyltransferase [Rickettsiales bacterium]
MIIKYYFYNIIKYVLIAQFFYITIASANEYNRSNPEPSSSIKQHKKTTSKKYMIVTADFRASQAANKILSLGGNALDAAIAAQNVLSVVEPQSSGLGGGGFLIYYDKKSQKIFAYDGRETASSNAKKNMFLNVNKEKMNFLKAVSNPISIGVPGLYSMLADAHIEHGIVKWEKLFAEAIVYAESFKVSDRLNKLLLWAPHIKQNTFVNETYYVKGAPKNVGSFITNPQLKESLQILSKNPYSLNKGELASLISAKLNKKITLKDLNNWKTIKRSAICKLLKNYKVCGFPPPTSGGVGVLQILGIINFKSDFVQRKNKAYHYHLFLEASRLAYLDRDHYIADPYFFKTPTSILISDKYLYKRSNLINDYMSDSSFTKGNFSSLYNKIQKGKNYKKESTTHISIVDSFGNAVALTTSIEFAFGSGITVGGFFLNNQLTDFSFISEDNNNNLIANSVAPGKKPRSSMAPTLIFENNNLIGVLGSPGGSRIICYVAKALFEIIYLETDPYDAVNKTHLCSRNEYSEIEDTKENFELIKNLKEFNHKIKVKKMTSGLNIIWKKNNKWYGIADKRREGNAIGH